MTSHLLLWAEYVIVTWHEGILSVDLRRISFEIDAFGQILTISDLPLKAWWLEQYISAAE